MPNDLRRAEMFSRLTLELTSADNLETVGNLLKVFCSSVWDWDAFSFSVRHGRGNRRFRAVSLIDTIDGEKVEFTQPVFTRDNYSLTWTTLLDGEAVLENRSEDHETAMSPFGSNRPSASLLFAPIRVADRVDGILSVQSYTPKRFDEEDLDLLVQVADAVGPTLLRCRAEERIQEFLNLGERLNQVVDTADVARVVANTAATLIGWDFISLHLYDVSKEKLCLVLGLSRSETQCTIIPEDLHEIPAPGTLLAQVLEGRILSFDSALLEAELTQLVPFGDSLPLLQSTILAPIRSLNKTVGLLCLQSEIALAYGQDEVEIARGLSGYCSGALERAWAEQNLKRSEENYRLLVENVNDGIVISQDDHFVFFNKRFAELLGYAYEELQSKTYEDIYSAKGLEILHERGRRRAAGFNVPNRYETLFVKKCGTTIPVEANVSIIENFQGKRATFAVIRDISERRAHEQMIRKSETQLRTLFNAMTDVIIVLDREGRYLRHGGDQSLLFAPWEKLEGKLITDVLSPEKADYFMDLISRALDSKDTLNVEYDLVDSDGQLRWFNSRVSAMADDTVLLVARDITERRNSEEELFRSNARYKTLLDGSEDYIFVLDQDLRFVHVNSAVEKRYQARPEDRIGKTIDALYDGKKPAPGYIELIKSVFRTGQPITYDDDAILNGRMVCTETVISPVFSRTGEVETVLGVSRDITSRRQSELALKQSEQRYAVAVQGANDGIWDWNLETDRLYLSPRWWAIVGKSADEIGDTDGVPEVWLQRVHYADLLKLREKIMDHINGKTPHLQDEHRILHADGSYRWVLCRGLCVRDEDGKPLQMAGSMSDITDRKVAEERLHHGATHDALTDLPNRSYFLDHLGKAMARSRRMTSPGEDFAVLFMDLDRFKVINDSLGHLAGDELIVTMGQRLERSVRPGDTVARLGGDEFTVLLEGLTSRSDATRVAERIIAALGEPVQISGFTVHTTVSVGIAFDKPDYQRPDDLLRDADTAMYRAKATGRSRYQVFDKQMHSNVMKQLQREAELRKAVENREFLLHYQPVYHLRDGRLTGFEALIRWNHPEHGLTSPANFIPVAEESGLIVPIGWWVFEEAARAAATWNKNRLNDNHLTVSINLSPRQFSVPDMVSVIREVISKAEARPEQIILEITENVLMEDSPHLAEVLQSIRDTGVRLDLDDFGTGYSSLSYLRRYPLDMLKVDRSFVDDLGNSIQSREIVSAMITLARGLGLGVTAEGVETRQQYEALLEMDCDWAQGYFFSKPVPFDQTFEIISSRSRFSPGFTV